MGTAPRSVNIVPHYHLFFTDSHIRRCNDGGLVPEEEGGGEESRSQGCRPSILQEVHLPLHQETDPSWSPHLFTDLVSFGSRHLVRGVPARVAAGGGSRQLPHPRHHLSHQPRDGDRWTGRTRLRLSIAPRSDIVKSWKIPTT